MKHFGIITILTAVLHSAFAGENEDIYPNLKEFEDKRTMKEQQMEERNQNSSVIIESEQVPDFKSIKKEKMPTPDPNKEPVPDQ